VIPESCRRVIGNRMVEKVHRAHSGSIASSINGCAAHGNPVHAERDQVLLVALKIHAAVVLSLTGRVRAVDATDESDIWCDSEIVCATATISTGAWTCCAGPAGITGAHWCNKRAAKIQALSRNEMTINAFLETDVRTGMLVIGAFRNGGRWRVLRQRTTRIWQRCSLRKQVHGTQESHTSRPQYYRWHCS